ncbi:MAG: peptidase [Bdellovibrionales bacterium]|nr:peptidase [Bdellovibrionales bacterium]
MSTKIITKDNYKNTSQTIGLSFFSSLIGGITTDQSLMNIPIDDHLVQRGDGVFEAMRVINKKAYHLTEHLLRLSFSASQIGLDLKYSLTEIENIIQDCINQAGLQTAMIRLFLSRGRGSFSVSPYSTTGSQLYIVVTPLTLPEQKMYDDGAKVYLSEILPKLSPFANIKSCNYLPNVMMKKEAIDNQSEFSLSFDTDGFLTEGATENVLILTQDLKLITPSYKKTLKGTTLNIVLKLAKSLKLKDVSYQNITKQDLLKAKAVMLCSTILEVLPVSEIKDKEKKITKLKDFSVAKDLRILLQKDMKIL